MFWYPRLEDWSEHDSVVWATGSLKDLYLIYELFCTLIGLYSLYISNYKSLVMINDLVKLSFICLPEYSCIKECPHFTSFIYVTNCMIVQSHSSDGYFNAFLKYLLYECHKELYQVKCFYVMIMYLWPYLCVLAGQATVCICSMLKWFGCFILPTPSRL